MVTQNIYNLENYQNIKMFQNMHIYQVQIKHIELQDLSGNITKEEIEKGLRNYEEFFNLTGIVYKNLITTLQEHTDIVMTVDEKSNFNLDNQPVDGICTNVRNNILATVNADCILILFFDPIKKVVANVHSGWRGTLQKISVKTVDKMVEQYKCNPQDIICCICPSIRKCHFEVEQDVKDSFVMEFQDMFNLDEVIEEKILGKKWNIDTVRINEILLEKRGLRKDNIIDCGICSVCNSDIIHSYRIEGKGNGLSSAIIGLK